MFTLKAVKVSPLYLLCIGLLVTILIVVSSGKPSGHYETDKDGVVRYYEPPIDHVCNDKTHNTCDGNCECDGMECESPIRVRQLRDYQLELTSTNQVLIWDGYRLVKAINLSDNCALNKVLLEDNE